MNRGLANFLSVLAHPVFVNLLNLYLLFFLFPPLSHGMPQRIQHFFISFIFISTSVIPLILVLVMRITGRIRSLSLETREERKLPYFLTLALYIFNYYNFVQSPAVHPLVLIYLIACAAIVGVVMVINFFNKISIHLTTLGAMTGLIIVGAGEYGLDYRLVIIPVLLFSGLIASARLSLKAHVPQQIYLGFLLGFVLMFLILRVSFTFA